MAIYCVSDIHGCYNEFMSLLDKVSPTESDIIYVLGDIIDRGPGSAQMLKWAVDKSNSNVKFLLGNHEDVSAAALISDPINIGLRMNDVWSYNGGTETSQQLFDETDAEWRQFKLVPWLQNLPLYDVVEANGKQWMLVHAGFNCSIFDEEINDSFIDSNFDRFSRQEYVDLSDYGFGIQYAQDMLWSRYQWLGYRKPAPMPVVFGHTPISKEFVDYLKEAKNLFVTGGDGKVAHIYNRVCIDCGCAHREAFSANWNLCMLRLDDMEEFYLR